MRVIQCFLLVTCLGTTGIINSSSVKAQNERIVEEIGRIGYAADFCDFPLTDGYLKARRQLRNGPRGEWFVRYYNAGYANARQAAALAGQTFCQASCIAHGPRSPSAQVGRQSFKAC